MRHLSDSAAPRPPFAVRPVVLAGHGLELDPAAPGDLSALLEVCPHEDLAFSPAWWGAEDPSVGREILERFCTDPDLVPFVMRSEGVVCGFTCYLDLRPDHRGLEIGHTWIGRRWRRTHVNPAAKLLLLEHAFEGLGAVRVSLKTDARNRISQAAMEKLGARREGVLRAHLLLPDGFRRDTVYYSILDEEWPQVRDGLLRRLVPPASPD